ncbi:MAG: flippase-like domain-containing protein [Proteobacteria bacterium]|nr:flippase-like domain-containing protein [Pseudomonadota bacterium]
MKSVISTIVKICISGAILFFLFRNINSERFFETALSINPLFPIATGLIFVATQLLSTLRWRTILNKDMYIPYSKLLSIYFIGMFFNNFLPTMVGGDVIKGYYLYKRSHRGDVSVTSIFMDRYSGFTALIFLTSIATVVGYPVIKGTPLPGFLLTLIAAYCSASLIIWVGPLHNWAMSIMTRIHFYGINKKIDSLYKALMGYKSHPGILIRVFCYSIVIQASMIICYWLLSIGLGMKLSLIYFFLFIPLATVISMLPVSLAGLGIREGAFVYLFTRAGATAEEALTLSLMWFAIMVVVSIAGGIEYIRTGGRKALPPAPPAEETPL